MIAAILYMPFLLRSLLSVGLRQDSPPARFRAGNPEAKSAEGFG